MLCVARSRDSLCQNVGCFICCVSCSYLPLPPQLSENVRRVHFSVHLSRQRQGQARYAQAIQQRPSNDITDMTPAGRQEAPCGHVIGAAPARSSSPQPPFDHFDAITTNFTSNENGTALNVNTGARLPFPQRFIQPTDETFGLERKRRNASLWPPSPCRRPSLRLS